MAGKKVLQEDVGTGPNGHKYVIRRGEAGKFLPGSHGPGRRPGTANPAAAWRNAMFRAWHEGGLSAPQVLVAWLLGRKAELPNGEDIDFYDPDMSQAERWLALQRIFAQMAPKEVAVAGDMDPEMREAAMARDRGVAAITEALFAELDARARRRLVDSDE